MLDNITKRERIALFALACGFIDTWTDCYICAYDGTLQKVTSQKAITTSVSRWHNSARIQKAFETISAQVEEMRETERKKAGFGEDSDKAGESVRTSTNGRKYTDFSRPENQFRKLNELVNTATDSAETLDALKVIMSAQKADREAARDGKVVKCYIPISCKDCKLYEKERKKVSL